jgi:uncharacterized protein YukJ
MKKLTTLVVARLAAWKTTLFFGLILQSAVAQDTVNLPYMNPNLSPEQRAAGSGTSHDPCGEGFADVQQLRGDSAAQWSRIPMVE